MYPSEYKNHKWAVPYDLSWEHFDNSKFGDLCTCERLYFLRHLCGIKPKYNHHFAFGSAWHAAMEAHEIGKPFSVAKDAFLKSLKENGYNITDPFDDEVYPKNIFRGVQAIKYYYEYYNQADDPYEILMIQDESTGQYVSAVEIRGNMEIFDHQFFFTFDSIRRQKTTGSIIIRDHKTTSTIWHWCSQWFYDMQAHTYSLAANLVLPKHIDYAGIQFSATQFKKTKTKDFIRELKDHNHGRSQFTFKRCAPFLLTNAALQDYTTLLAEKLTTLSHRMDQWQQNPDEIHFWLREMLNCRRFLREPTETQAAQEILCPMFDVCTGLSSGTFDLNDVRDGSFYDIEYWDPGAKMNNRLYAAVGALEGVKNE